MRKAIIIAISIAAIFIALGLVAYLAWNARASIASHLIEKNLGTPVTIQSLELDRTGAQINRFTIYNPSGFRSRSAFEAQTIDIDTTLKQLRADPLTIHRIEMNRLLITIEEGKKGSTNWDQILAHKSKPSSSNRGWLIKKLVLTDLTVQVIKANGSVKRYPTLKRMEFNNLSDQTGFPVDEIEKAIFNQMMMNLIRNLNLQKIINPLLPQGASLPSLPNLF